MVSTVRAPGEVSSSEGVELIGQLALPCLSLWPVTDFLDLHPGGAKIILANAGKDVSKVRPAGALG